MSKVHMALLLGESGSMGGREQGVIDGVNEFVGSLRDEQTPDEVRVSLRMFDLASAAEDNVRVKWDDKLLADVPALAPGDYQPRGATPLNDAVIETIERVSGQMSDSDRALLVVYTDGLENSSRASYEDVAKLVQAKEAANWSFIYLGAKQDAWAKQDSHIAMDAAGPTFTTTTTSKGAHSSIAAAGNLAASYASIPDKATYQARAAQRPKDIAEDEIDRKPTRGRKPTPANEWVEKARRQITGSGTSRT